MSIKSQQRDEEGLRNLHRSVDNKVLGGVASGLADYLGLEVSVVRVGMVALCFLGAVAIPLYVAAWLFIPAEGADSTIADDWLEDARICRLSNSHLVGVPSPKGHSPTVGNPIDDALGNDAANERTVSS